MPYPGRRAARVRAVPPLLALVPADPTAERLAIVTELPRAREASRGTEP